MDHLCGSLRTHCYRSLVRHHPIFKHQHIFHVDKDADRRKESAVQRPTAFERLAGHAAAKNMVVRISKCRFHKILPDGAMRP